MAAGEEQVPHVPHVYVVRNEEGTEAEMMVCLDRARAEAEAARLTAENLDEDGDLLPGGAWYVIALRTDELLDLRNTLGL